VNHHWVVKSGLETEKPGTFVQNGLLAACRQNKPALRDCRKESSLKGLLRKEAEVWAG